MYAPPPIASAVVTSRSRCDSPTGAIGPGAGLHGVRARARCCRPRHFDRRNIAGATLAFPLLLVGKQSRDGQRRPVAVPGHGAAMDDGGMTASLLLDAA